MLIILSMENGIIAVLKGLYFSNEFMACQRAQLVQRNVRYLVNAGHPKCTEHYERIYYTYLSIDFNDVNNAKADYTIQFDLLFDFIGN